MRMFSADIPVFLIRVSFCCEMASSRKHVRLFVVIDVDSESRGEECVQEKVGPC